MIYFLSDVNVFDISNKFSMLCNMAAGKNGGKEKF